MNRHRLSWVGVGLLSLSGVTIPVASAQEAAVVKPLTEGPLHEAFLSPAKDREPARAPKAPPAAITERPGIDRPDESAQWIEGYWTWDAKKNDFLWVTGTWRVPPPGRFWVNGYWKRDENGWYRVAGFWSDRQTDRIDYRKGGPPADRPADEPGPAPGEEYFYVPGNYAPDGNGVVWKPGFWAKAQEGWSWVPAQWIKQPEGWVYQAGYWDRTLEDRGILFTPAQVNTSGNTGDIVYSPLSQVSPDSYARLYGAFGRPTTYYDGYPGCYYDPSGNYYGYANYGSIGLYNGYLDYPYTDFGGYPYSVYPTTYAGYGGYGGYGLGYGCYSLYSSCYSPLISYGYSGGWGCW